MTCKHSNTSLPVPMQWEKILTFFTGGTPHLYTNYILHSRIAYLEKLILFGEISLKIKNEEQFHLIASSMTVFEKVERNFAFRREILCCLEYSVIDSIRDSISIIDKKNKNKSSLT